MSKYYKYVIMCFSLFLIIFLIVIGLPKNPFTDYEVINPIASDSYSEYNLSALERNYIAENEITGSVLEGKTLKSYSDDRNITITDSKYLYDLNNGTTIQSLLFKDANKLILSIDIPLGSIERGEYKLLLSSSSIMGLESHVSYSYAGKEYKTLGGFKPVNNSDRLYALDINSGVLKSFAARNIVVRISSFIALSSVNEHDAFYFDLARSFSYKDKLKLGLNEFIGDSVSYKMTNYLEVKDL